MRVVMIGTGYVGLVSGTCFAELGHDVVCVDIDQNKIDMLERGDSPIYEPGLEELMRRNVESGRLSFSNNYESTPEAESVFLAVGTPSGDDGRANLEYLYRAAESVIPLMKENCSLVIKSTVPIGTHKEIRAIISKLGAKNIHVVNNPEFLKEGSAIDDFMKPDRVIIGHDSERASALMKELYAPLVRQGNPIYMMSNLSAEMTKYAANSFLATKISFINEIARLCDLTGADIEQVRLGITSDQRIGKHFLYPGPGYGGSCFPKDVKALIATAKDFDLNLQIVSAVEDVNAEQKVYLASKIVKEFGKDLSGKTFAFWGVAFKPNTDDIRETPAIEMAVKLTELGAKVKFYDPVAGGNYISFMKSRGIEVEQISDKHEVLDRADALVLLTEWSEFRAVDFSTIAQRLNNKVIFDGRNLFDAKKLKDLGFKYYGIGK